MEKSTINAAATELFALRRFDGPPPEFWRRYLAALGAITGANEIHLFRVVDDSPETLAPSAAATREQPRRLAAWSSTGAIPPPPPADVFKRDGQTTVPLVTGDETQRASAVFVFAPNPGADPRPVAERVSVSPQPADETLAPSATSGDIANRLTPARVAADVPRDYLERRRATQQTRDVSLFAATLDLLVLLNEQTRFNAAAMLVCNELAARHGCERVSLGWLHNHQAQLVALSHAEKFDRRTEAVRALELAMEECADQDEEILFPPETDARQVKRDHAAYVRAHAPGNVCSVPLRTSTRVCGVLFFERQNRARAAGEHRSVASVPAESAATEQCPPGGTFSDDELAAFRITADQIARRLADLQSMSGGLLRQSLARARGRLAGWAGPTHTWWKVGGVFAAVLLLFGLFGRLPYRVKAPFLLRSDQVAYVTAPFDSFLYAAALEPGEEVAAGQTLFALDTRDLLLEESVARANLVRHEREAERARAADSLGEMRIAEALAEQARAQLEQARWRLSRAEVKAPFAGAVLEGDLKRRLGAPVRAGDVLMQVARLDTLFFDVQVAERDINEVTVGARLRLAFASQPDTRFAAVVERIEPAARATPQGAVFIARCQLVDARAAWWRPGMGGVARIDAGWRMPLWIVTHRTIDWLRMRFWW